MSISKSRLKEIRQHCIESASHIVGPFEVKLEQQEQILAVLRETCNYERFFFVINVKEYCTKLGYGINRWLGQPDNLSMDEYLSIQSPTTFSLHVEYAKLIMNKVTKGEVPFDFMRGSFSGLQAMRHRDGRYLLVKRVSSVFQFNKKREMLEYLNEFTIIGDYNGEPFKLSSMDLPPIIEENLRQYVKDSIYHILPFSFQELKLLKLYAYLPNITEKIAAEKLTPGKVLSVNSIKKYKERIIEKAKNYFQSEFKSVDSVVVFLKQQYLI